MTLAPGRIWPGTPVRLTNSYTDASGNAVDPTTVTIKVMSPSGVESSYVYGTDDEMGRSAAGIYYADITTDRGGRWFYRWITSGSGTTIANEGDFIVQMSPFVDGLGSGDYWR